MIKKLDFFLPCSDYYYLKHKEVFTRPQTARVSSVFTPNYIPLERGFFQGACENPLYTPAPTFSGIVGGFLCAFHYKLYLEIILYTTLFFCFNILCALVFSSFMSKLFQYFTFAAYYFFITLYSKTLWARKIRMYLQYHPEASKKQLLWRFKPHNILTTFFVGTIYTVLVLMAHIWLMNNFFTLIGF